MFDGSQGASGADSGLVARDRLGDHRVVERQRQVDATARHHEVLGGGQRRLEPDEDVDQRAHRDHRRVDVHVQAAHAGRDVDDARGALQRLAERVHAHAQAEVQHHRAVLDEHVVVAAAQVDDVGRRRRPGRARRRHRRGR